MSDEAGGLTAEERGDGRVAVRGVVRVVMIVAVVALTVGVVLVGNLLHTGTFLPWFRDAGRSDTAVVPRPAPSSSADAAAEVPRTPAERVAAEDERLSAVATLPADDPALLASWNTVVLAPRGGQTVYGVADLVAAGAARLDDPETVTLVRDVVVRSGAELRIEAAPDAVRTVRLSSSPDATTSIVAWGGALTLDGTSDVPLAITSWDDTIDAPDTDETDGRAYIRARDGSLTLTSTTVGDLGYWSGRTGGLAVTGSGYTGAVATLTDVSVSGLHYGFFGSATTSVTISDSRVDDSLLTGIEVTNGARDTTVTTTTVSGSGGDGISLSRQSTALQLTDVTVEGSSGWGVRVDGSALADGPTTGGYGLTPSSGFSVVESRVQDNRDGGIRVISTDDTEITRTTVNETRTAVLVEGPSAGLSVDGVDLTSAELRGLDLSGRITDATVSGSRIEGRRIAVEMTSAAVIMRGNDLTVASAGSAVELAEDARADITSNVFHGVGQDAVATWSGALTMQADNDESGWTFQWAWVGWMNERPMMWLWALVLLVPAIGLPVLWRRRREHQRLRTLLHEALLRHGREQMEQYGSVQAPTETALVPVGRDVPGEAGTDVAAGAGDARIPPVRGPGSWSNGQRTQAPSGTGSAVPTGPAHTPRSPQMRPRSFADLRTGPLEGRTFASLQEFAVAAVREGGYSVATIARLFRIQHWRLQQWVDEAAARARSGSERTG